VRLPGNLLCAGGFIRPFAKLRHYDDEEFGYQISMKVSGAAPRLFFI
jgi:hypothetical protein